LKKLTLPEEQAIDSQITVTGNTPDKEETVEGTKRVSIAWLCFDRDKVYLRHGSSYIKCNQLCCGKEFKLNRSTSTNLTRHVKSMHKSLLPKKNPSKVSQMTIAHSNKKKIIPNFSQEHFKNYLINLFVVSSISAIGIKGI
jgi:hypothetical protein